MNKLKYNTKSKLLLLLLILSLFNPIAANAFNTFRKVGNDLDLQEVNFSEFQLNQNKNNEWEVLRTKADKNRNGINDNFEIRLEQISEFGFIEEDIDDYSSISPKKPRIDFSTDTNKPKGLKITNDAIPVIISFPKGNFKSISSFFEDLGGIIKNKYTVAINGFAGSIDYTALLKFCSTLRENNIHFLVEEDRIYHAQLYYAGRNMNLRPYVWNTLSYDGDYYSSIAIMDTGIDASHDFFGIGYSDGNPDYKIVGWRDEVNSTSIPYDDNGHGSHCSGITSGQGIPQYDSQGRSVSTAAYEISDDVTGIVSPGSYEFNWARFNVTNPGVIEISVEFEDLTPAPDDVDFWAYLYYGDTLVDSYIDMSDIWTYNLSYSVSSSELGLYSFAFELNLSDNSGDGYVYDWIMKFRSEIHWPFNPPLFGSGDPWKGVAPDAHLVGVKVLDQYGSGYSSDIIDGINWVIANKNTYNITTMSLSLGGGPGATSMINAVNNAVENGIVTVVSAGNSGPGGYIGSPGDADNVITVAASSINDEITSYSSQGGDSYTGFTIKPDITAPGGSFNNLQIFSADSNDNDAYGAYPSDGYLDNLFGAQGTSMSAPAVAGAANLLIEAMGGHQSWSYTSTEAKSVKALLLMSATETYPLLRESSGFSYSPSLNRGGKDVHEGYGRINIDIAIEAYTQQLTLGSYQNTWISSSYENAFSKHGHGCYVNLINGEKYTFALEVPDNADFDLHLYRDSPSSIGDPIMVGSSISSSLGAEEFISYTASETGKYYLIAKAISGEGNANITYPILDHDLSVFLEVPKDSELSNTYHVNATVLNNGNYDENNFDLLLYLDDVIVNSTTISSLTVGNTETITYSWNPMEYKTYNFTVYAPPIPGESFFLNNKKTEFLSIREIKVFDGLYINHTFSATGISAASQFSYTQISDELFHVDWDLFVGMQMQTSNWTENAKNRTMSNAIGGFGSNAHTPVWIFNDASIGDSILIAVDGLGDSIFNVSRELYYELPGYGIVEAWELEDLNNPGGLAIYEKTTGLLIYGLFYYFEPFYGQIFSYEIEFEDTNAIFSYVTFDHDLKAVVEIPSFCEVGNTYTINATVFNQGLNIESNVGLILYLDNVSVSSTTISSLSIGASSTINFEWTPTEFGMYNFTCFVPTVSGEVYTDNNVITKMVPIKEIILFDGMYINYLMDLSGTPENATVSYTHTKESMFHVDWTQYVDGIKNDGYWDVDAYTRLMTDMGGNTTFSSYQHTPIWIFNDVSLDDIVPIGVGIDPDHDFIVSGESIYVVPGYGPIEVWVLEDLANPLGEAWYDKNTGILIKGTFSFFFIFFMITYTMELVSTNAIYPQINPPGSFTLSSTADSPDTDGNFDLTWTSSSGADNYSVYMDDSYITQIDGSLTLLADQDATSPYPITGLTSGTYYFIVVAYNETGYTLSDCLQVTVSMTEPPGPFTLTSTAGSPDTDGNFDLTWTSSSGADNYSIYRYSSYISEINGFLTLIAEGVTDLQRALSGYSDGTYYFIIEAQNEDGDTLSDCIMVEVQIPVVVDNIIVTNPDSNSIWEIGTSHIISWTSTGSISNVKIELYKGGALERTIIANTPNDDSFEWTIPTDLTDGIDYQIRISDASNPTTYGESPDFALTTAATGDEGIPGYNLLFLLGIITIFSIISIRKLIKRKPTDQEKL